MADTPDDLSEEIRTQAATPQTIAVDGLSTTNRPMGDLIQADKYLAKKRAASNPFRSVRLARLPGGSPAL